MLRLDGIEYHDYMGSHLVVDKQDHDAFVEQIVNILNYVAFTLEDVNGVPAVDKALDILYMAQQELDEDQE